FFSSRRRHTISDRDWSSDVCSSDLVIAESFLPLDRAEEKVKEIVIAIPSTGLVDSAVGRIRDLLGGRPGPCPVYLEVTEPRSFRVTLRAGNALKISPSRDLTLALEDLLGKGAVRFR